MAMPVSIIPIIILIPIIIIHIIVYTGGSLTRMSRHTEKGSKPKKAGTSAHRNQVHVHPSVTLRTTHVMWT